MDTRFIVLTDLTEHSDNLIRYASDWSRKLGDTDMLLLHKIDFYISGRVEESKREDLISRALSEATDHLRDYFNTLMPGYPEQVRFKATMYSLPEVLKSLPCEGCSQLVFTGLKGTGLLKKILFGSHALDVINHTPHMVAAIPTDIDRFNPERIIVALEKENQSNISALDSLLALLGPVQPEICFFLVSGTAGEEEEAKRLGEHIEKKIGNRYQVRLRHFPEGEFLEEIGKIKERRTGELLVIQRNTGQDFNGLFRQAALNDLIYEGQTPLIVLP